MSSSEDSYDLEQYSLECYEEDEGPPLIKKRSRLIAAVVHNHVDVLRDLLDSPRWYNAKDKFGYTLLQIAILRDNKEVFDYMLSIPEFPLDYVNKHEETALMFALSGFIRNDITMSEYFAYELVKKGACLDKICYDDNTLLHCALDGAYTKLAKFLILSGADVNALNDEGETPLLTAVGMHEDCTETLSTLLVYGAEPSIDIFEHSVLSDHSLLLQENLFFYTFDEYSNPEINIGVLFKLAETESPLFFEVIKYPIKLNIIEWQIYTYIHTLCSIRTVFLKILIEKFGSYISEIFKIAPISYFSHYSLSRIENLNVLLESDFRSDVINFLNSINNQENNQEPINIQDSTVIERYCYLLSYGFVISEQDLQLVYQKFGYCELFKILLHMDREFDIDVVDTSFIKVMPKLIYDVNMNLEKYVQNPLMYCDTSICDLLHYFAHPKLKEIYDQSDSEKMCPQERNIPQIPLLVELARNEFRNFFIETFEIRTSRKFYTLLKCLRISSVHEKIITYETKLY